MLPWQPRHVLIEGTATTAAPMSTLRDTHTPVCQPFREEGMGARDVPRAGSWAVPVSQGWLLPSPCTAGVSGLPP